MNRIPRTTGIALPAVLLAGLLTGTGASPNAGAGTLLFSHGTVHTVSGAVLSNASVRVRDGTIERVGPGAEGPADLVVPLDGRHLYPGLLVAATSLGLVEVESVRGTRDASEVGEFTPDVQSWIAVNPDSELIPVARANGITHAVPVPAGKLVAGQSGLMALDGWTAETMTVRAPIGLHVYWPELLLDLTPRERAADRAKWKSPEDQARERRARVKALEEFFAEARAYHQARAGAGRDGVPPLAPVPAWEAMGPWVRGERPVMVHAEDARAIRAAVRWAAAQRLRMVLVGGRDAVRVAGELASNSIPVLFDAVFNLPPRDTDRYDELFRAPALLHEAGVKVSFNFGGRHEASDVRNLPYLAAQAVAFGLPREDGVRGLTLRPAEALGVADRLGSIDPGKEASLIVTDGDLLDVRTRVERMWIAGREVPLDSRHTRLYEKYRQRPRPAGR